MKFEPILSPQTWLTLSIDTRNYLRRVFDIPRSGHVEVFDGRVLTDGTMITDLQSLTVKKMQDYLNSEETDFYELFNKVIEKIENPNIDYGEIKRAEIVAQVETYEETEPVVKVKVTKDTSKDASKDSPKDITNKSKK